MRQHQVALVAFIRPAHGHGVGAGDAAHARDEAARQLIEVLRAGDEGADFVEGRQSRALDLEPRRLFPDLGFEPAVQRLQMFGHRIEPVGQFAEFVVGQGLDTGVEVAGPDAREPRAEPAQGLEHHPVGRIQHQHRARDRHRQHQQLKTAQHGGPVRQALLDEGDEAIDVVDKGTCLARNRGRRATGPARAQRRPLRAQAGELGLCFVAARNEERARRVAGAQQLECGVDRGGLGHDGAAIAAGDVEGHPVGQHAHAAGLVDGRRATFELPGHPQGEADRRERQHQKTHAGAHQFEREGLA